MLSSRGSAPAHSDMELVCLSNQAVKADSESRSQLGEEDTLLRALFNWLLNAERLLSVCVFENFIDIDFERELTVNHQAELKGPLKKSSLRLLYFCKSACLWLS